MYFPFLLAAMSGIPQRAVLKMIIKTIQSGPTQYLSDPRIKIEISRPFVFQFGLNVTSQVIYGFHFSSANVVLLHSDTGKSA